MLYGEQNAKKANHTLMKYVREFCEQTVKFRKDIDLSIVTFVTFRRHAMKEQLRVA